MIYHVAVRIKNGDEGFEEDDWQQEHREAGGVSQSSLRADRLWTEKGLGKVKDTGKGRCLGIRCNIWACAMQRREIIHYHRGGGSHSIGWGKLVQEMVGTDEVRFGKHRELCCLPKNKCQLPT
jgi:hypothetical protein